MTKSIMRPTFNDIFAVFLNFNGSMLPIKVLRISTLLKENIKKTFGFFRWRIKCKYTNVNASSLIIVESLQTNIYSEKAAAAISPISVIIDTIFVIGEEEADEK